MAGDSATFGSVALSLASAASWGAGDFSGGLASLSAREKEVFDLAAAGYTNRRIAAALFISERTVETHRSRINRKLGIRSPAELIRSAIEVAKGLDFVDDDDDPTDPLDPPNAGHGTSTGSVMLSDEGPAGVPHVTGVAPRASLVPLRVSSSVVHYSWTRLAKALYRAIEDDESEHGCRCVGTPPCTPRSSSSVPCGAGSW